MLALVVAPASAANILLLTQSVTIQNFGRERADWVEVVHAQRPDFFQLNPSLRYTEKTAQNGEYTLRVESLAPKEFFTIPISVFHTHANAFLHPVTSGPRFPNALDSS